MTRYPELRDRVVLVTGAASGVGAAVAQSFAEEGARVALCDVDGAGLDAVAARLAVPEGQHVEIAADLGDATQPAAVVSEVVGSLGRLDVLVNNAAVLTSAPLADVSVEAFDRVIAVNLRAPFLLAQAAMPHLRAGGSGRIVNVASIAVRTGGSADVFAYTASKGGLVALTKALAREGAPDGVLVNAVLPAAIDTPMLATGFDRSTVDSVLSRIPLGRLSQPAEIAAVVLWLSTDGASYMTGASVDVNGGWVMA